MFERAVVRQVLLLCLAFLLQACTVLGGSAEPGPRKADADAAACSGPEPRCRDAAVAPPDASSPHDAALPADVGAPLPGDRDAAPPARDDAGPPARDDAASPARDDLGPPAPADSSVGPPDPDAGPCPPGADAGPCPAADGGGPEDVDCHGALPHSWLRVMSYNIKHGAVRGLDAVAEVIREVDPDLVGLQEVDDQTRRSGGVAQADRLGQLTGMDSLFSKAINYDGGRYGLAVLSRWPILGSERIALTSRGEARILLIVRVGAPDGSELHLAVTHLGTSAADRSTQAEEVRDALLPLTRVVLLGDFNASPGGSVHTMLTQNLRDAWELAGDGAGFTFPANDPESRIDWLLLSPDLPAPRCAWVPETRASDHRPVVVVMPLAE